MLPGGGNLRYDRMPPLWVPLRAFLVAPFLGATAGVVLASAGSRTMDNRFTGELLGGLHLLTLGFLTLVMVGAIVQVLPVVTGMNVPFTALVGPLTQAGLVLGVPAMAWGLAQGSGPAAGVGAVVLGTGLGIFTASVLVGAWGARRNVTGRAMALAVVSLVVVAGLGVSFLAGHAGWGPLRRDLTDVHLGWALAGWIALLVIGVSFQVVPMFQVTPAYPRPMQEILPATLFASLVLWTVGRIQSVGPIADLGVLLVCALLTGYGGTTLWLQAHRRRKLRDVTTDCWRVGMVSLVVASLMVAAGTVGLLDLGETQMSITFGLVAVFGFGVSVVTGMLYKIVPFLSWLHLQNLLTESHLMGQVKIRNMRQLLPVTGPQNQFVAHLVAYAMLVAAPWLAADLGGWVRWAGVALIVDLSWLGFELLGVVSRHGEDRALIENHLRT